MSSLSEAQRNEIKEMIHSAVTGIHARLESDYKVIDNKLELILGQTTKHNQRMSKAEHRMEDIEKREVVHVANCPIAERVKDLEEKDIAITSIKTWKDKWLKVLIGLAGGGVIINTVMRIIEHFIN